MSFRKYRNWPFLSTFLKLGILNDRISPIKPALLHKNPLPPFLREKKNRQTNKQSSEPLAQSNCLLFIVYGFVCHKLYKSNKI